MEDLFCRVSSSCRGPEATVMKRTLRVFASFHNGGIKAAGSSPAGVPFERIESLQVVADDVSSIEVLGRHYICHLAYVAGGSVKSFDPGGWRSPSSSAWPPNG